MKISIFILLSFLKLNGQFGAMGYEFNTIIYREFSINNDLLLEEFNNKRKALKIRFF